VLIDKICAYKAETRIVPGGLLEGGIITIYPHTKQCALMPDCQKSGYGVFTYDQKFLPFDEAGNQRPSLTSNRPSRRTTSAWKSQDKFRVRCLRSRASSRCLRQEIKFKEA
jgi:hypothetical protein